MYLERENNPKQALFLFSSTTCSFDSCLNHTVSLHQEFPSIFSTQEQMLIFISLGWATCKNLCPRGISCSLRSCYQLLICLCCELQLAANSANLTRKFVLCYSTDYLKAMFPRNLEGEGITFVYLYAPCN